MRYFAQSYQNKYQGSNTKQKCRIPRLECQCWGSYQDNSLAIACVEVFVLLRVDAHLLTQ